MPFRKKALALAATSILFSSICLAESPDLVVNVSNAKPATGTLEISLFNSTETFMKQPYLQTSGPIKESGNYKALFGKLPPGEYAVVVVHDENGNGKLDTGFLGLGGESYAFSNDVRPFFGWPDFEDVKFSVQSDKQIEIVME